MKIAFIGGTHPRHLSYLHAIAASFDVAFALLQSREGMLPQPPSGTNARDRTNWQRHFENRDAKEAEYFGKPGIPHVDFRLIDPGDLNTPASARTLYDLAPDVVLIFGCGMIREPLFSALPKATYNLHLGLSPRYRGAATLFWPQYFLEPQFAGTTLHKIVYEPDAGDIVHQTVPDLYPDDTIHDVSCRAVTQATEEVIPILGKLECTGKLDTYAQTATGKNFLASDFQPAHLRTIYDEYGDRIVDAYLSGELRQTAPKLRRQAIWQPEPLLAN